ncbi:hypothetical protein [Erythrobacter sp.]|uniref:hypothetical protein n=1 Tax=Erythrobacter sp. TaxID=1042 RepID=UPI001425E7B1|nr:hypothetical protein [Erythrobacter sp.]QIQ85548.1 MAG: hypothetical protein G9473_01765 [Erythrobacter sp.]
MRRALALLVAGALATGLAACKPPPTDETLTREAPVAEPVFASAPLPSPEAEGAVWAKSAKAADRIVYGIPGEPALIALACDRAAGTLTITRFAPADEGAEAMLALIGNGHVGRLPVDATEAGKLRVWQGTHDAASEEWEPLAGPRKLTATLPGAGMVELAPSPLPMELVETCRAVSG